MTRWLVGAAALVLLPLGALPLLGYAVSCTRSADADGPPGWRLDGRTFADGFLVLCAIAVIAAPFVVVALPIDAALRNQSLWHSTSPLLDVEAATSAALVVALPWGVVMLLLMPHAVARFATTRSARDLFDYPASLRGVRRDFSTWNVVIAAIVTAWAIGLACSALFCVGIIPGIFYAILVSAHATAALRPEGPDPSAR